jgi:hypothetical protein
MFKTSQLFKNAASRFVNARSATSQSLPEAMRLQGISSSVVIHFDGFFRTGEPGRKSIDRLRAALEWVCRHYDPVSLPAFRDMISRGEVKDNTVLLTCDCVDRRFDLAVDEFRYVNAPLTAIISVGQTMLASGGPDEHLAAYVIGLIDSYTGAPTNFPLGRDGTLSLSSGSRADAISQIVARHGDDMEVLQEILDRLKSHRIAEGYAPTWSDLRDLEHLGVTFGTSGISKRNRPFSDETGFHFEVKQAMAVLKSKNFVCGAFMMHTTPLVPASHVAGTLRSEDLAVGLVQEPGFITAPYDPCRLPVITIPRSLTTLNQFRAYATGANIHGVTRAA